MVLRVLKTLVIIVVLVLIAAVLYLSYGDLNWMKPRIEAAAVDATGRTLSLNGKFDLDIVPSPSVTVEDASFSNADWGSEPNMAEIGKFHVEVGFWSLLSGPVRVHQLHLEDVSVLLEKSSDGQANWQLSAPEPAPAQEESAAPGSDGLPVLIEALSMRNIQVVVKEPGAEPSSFVLSALDMNLDEATYLNIQGTGEFAEEPLALAGRIGPEEAMAEGPGIEFTLEPTYGDYPVKLDGTVDVLADVLALDNLNIQHRDASAQVDIVLARTPDASGEFIIAAGGPSLASLQPGLPDIDFEAQMTVDKSADVWKLSGIKASFGESDLSGDLQLTLGEKPVIDGTLSSDLLNLTPFAAPAADPEAESGAEPGKTESEGEQKPSKYVFREEPLQLDGLHSADIDLKTTVGELVYKKIVVKDIVTSVELAGGKLQLNNTMSGTQEGRAVSSVKLDAHKEGAAELAVDIKARDMRLNVLSGDEATIDIIPPIGITVDVKTAGTSPRTMAAASAGRILVTQDNGEIQTGLAGVIAGDVVAQLFKALNPFAEEDPYTELDCTVLGINLGDGQADITGMLLQTEKVKAMGEGAIDLNTEKLNLSFETQPRKGVGVSPDMFVTPFVKLGGTMASPAVSLNKKGVLLKGGAAFFTGGLSLLAEGAADRSAGNVDRCAEVLKLTGGHPPIDG